MRSIFAARQELRQAQRREAEAYHAALSQSTARIGERQDLLRLSKERQREAVQMIENRENDALATPIAAEMSARCEALVKAVKHTGIIMAEEKMLVSLIESESSEMLERILSVWTAFQAEITVALKPRPLDLEPLDLELHTRLQAAHTRAAEAAHRADKVDSDEEAPSPARAPAAGAPAPSSSPLKGAPKRASFGVTLTPFGGMELMRDEEVHMTNGAMGLNALETLKLLLDTGEIGDEVQTMAQRTGAFKTLARLVNELEFVREEHTKQKERAERAERAASLHRTILERAATGSREGVDADDSDADGSFSDGGQGRGASQRFSSPQETVAAALRFGDESAASAAEGDSSAMLNAARRTVVELRAQLEEVESESLREIRALTRANERMRKEAEEVGEARSSERRIANDALEKRLMQAEEQFRKREQALMDMVAGSAEKLKDERVTVAAHLDELHETLSAMPTANGGQGLSRRSVSKPKPSGAGDLLLKRIADNAPAGAVAQPQSRLLVTAGAPGAAGSSRRSLKAGGALTTPPGRGGDTHRPMEHAKALIASIRERVASKDDMKRPSVVARVQEGATRLAMQRKALDNAQAENSEFKKRLVRLETEILSSTATCDAAVRERDEAVAKLEADAAKHTAIVESLRMELAERERKLAQMLNSPGRRMSSAPREPRKSFSPNAATIGGGGMGLGLLAEGGGAANEIAAMREEAAAAVEAAKAEAEAGAARAIATVKEEAAVAQAAAVEAAKAEVEAEVEARSTEASFRQAQLPIAGDRGDNGIAPSGAARSAPAGAPSRPPIGAPSDAPDGAPTMGMSLDALLGGDDDDDDDERGPSLETQIREAHLPGYAKTTAAARLGAMDGPPSGLGCQQQHEAPEEHSDERQWGMPPVVTYQTRFARDDDERDAMVGMSIAPSHPAALAPVPGPESRLGLPIPQPLSVAQEMIERAADAARAQERAVLRELLHSETKLEQVAQAAARTIVVPHLRIPANGADDAGGEGGGDERNGASGGGGVDGSAGADAAAAVSLSEQLVRERLVSATLQARLDEITERIAERFAAERRHNRGLLEQYAKALDMRQRAEADAMRKRCKMLAGQLSLRSGEVTTLKSFNAQLLNEADPLMLSTPSKLNWPRNTDLQPPALGATGMGDVAGGRLVSPRPPHGSRPASARAAIQGGGERLVSPRPQSAHSAGRSMRPQSATTTPRPQLQPSPPAGGRAHSPTAFGSRLHAEGTGFALTQASSGLTNARVARRVAPPLLDTLEAVVLRRAEFETQREVGSARRPSKSPAASTASDDGKHEHEEHEYEYDLTGIRRYVQDRP